MPPAIQIRVRRDRQKDALRQRVAELEARLEQNRKTMVPKKPVDPMENMIDQAVSSGFVDPALSRRDRAMQYRQMRASSMRAAPATHYKRGFHGAEGERLGEQNARWQGVMNEVSRPGPLPGDAAKLPSRIPVGGHPAGGIVDATPEVNRAAMRAGYGEGVTRLPDMAGLRDRYNAEQLAGGDAAQLLLQMAQAGQAPGQGGTFTNPDAQALAERAAAYGNMDLLQRAAAVKALEGVHGQDRARWHRAMQANMNNPVLKAGGAMRRNRLLSEASALDQAYKQKQQAAQMGLRKAASGIRRQRALTRQGQQHIRQRAGALERQADDAARRQTAEDRKQAMMTRQEARAEQAVKSLQKMGDRLHRQLITIGAPPDQQVKDEEGKATINPAWKDWDARRRYLQKALDGIEQSIAERGGVYTPNEQVIQQAQQEAAKRQAKAIQRAVTTAMRNITLAQTPADVQQITKSFEDAPPDVKAQIEQAVMARMRIMQGVQTGQARRRVRHATPSFAIHPEWD